MPFARKIECWSLRYDKKAEIALPERKKPGTSGIYLLPWHDLRRATGNVDPQAKGGAGNAR